MRRIEIDGCQIGRGAEPFVVAEAGTNFRGDVALGKAFVEAAAEAGADAVKFQTLDPKTALSRPGLAAIGMADLYDRIGDSTLSRADHESLQAHCAEHDVTFLSTPFSAESVELLADLDVPAIKIGSGELTDFHLLETAVETGKPLLVSTGMADMETVERTYEFLTDRDATFGFMYCVSLYPAEPEEFDLGVIKTMRERFDVPVGISDHSTGVAVSAIAMARGASVVEKHFTIDRRLPGGDQEVSIEPDELATLVEYAGLVDHTRGDEKRVHEGERDVAEWAHHSVVAARSIAAGEELNNENVTTKRPGTGIPASRYHEVLGATLETAVDADTVLTEGHLR
jgi:N-acetylneuraminate synthase/N,N'-diacetyllegionaminate synthase